MTDSLLNRKNTKCNREKSSWIINSGDLSRPNTLIAKIYFSTNNAELGPDDIRVLNSIRDYYSVVLIGFKVHFKIVGNADIRGSKQHNLMLSKRRAKSVRDYLDNHLGNKGGNRNYKSSLIAHGEEFGGIDLDEDRRVDIYVTENQVRKIKQRRRFNYAKPLIFDSNYPYQYWCDNQDLFRPLIFMKFHPDYNSFWRQLQLDHLIKRFEELHTINMDHYIWIDSKDEIAIINLIDHYFRENEIGNTLNDMKIRNRHDVLAECFAIIYRNQYDEAIRRCDLEFSQSDFRYQCEWFAHVFGKVPGDTPYTKRSSR